jgi:hypothetical protein
MRSIVGVWRTPEQNGIEISYYFYPDGVFITQNPRRREFVTRGSWSLEGEQLTLSNIRYLNSTKPTDTEPQCICVPEISDETMVWQSPNQLDKITFRRGGDLPDRNANPYWREPLE